MKGTVHYETRGNIALMTVDNPPVNPLSSGVRQGLYDGVEKALADDSVAAIVLTGAGRAFIAGADISEFGSAAQEGVGLHEALVMLQEEGLENAFARYLRNHRALVAGLEAMGLSMAVAPEHRLPQLNAVNIPEGVEDAEVRTALLRDFNLEIGAGLGALAGKTWRIGLMGYASNERNVITCLTALEAVLGRQGAAINTGEALAAAEAAFSA